jgi:hypothetical protein
MITNFDDDNGAGVLVVDADFDDWKVVRLNRHLIDHFLEQFCKVLEDWVDWLYSHRRQSPVQVRARKQWLI